jgi:hypothetical protein
VGLLPCLLRLHPARRHPALAVSSRAVRLNSRPLVILAALVGIALIVLAIVYWAEPAGSLPSWIPGHEAGSGHHHVKHGIAAFLVGLALLVFAWFQTGKREPASDEAA